MFTSLFSSRLEGEYLSKHYDWSGGGFWLALATVCSEEGLVVRPGLPAWVGVDPFA